MLERRAKKKSMNSYNKMADFDNKKGKDFLSVHLFSLIQVTRDDDMWTCSDTNVSDNFRKPFGDLNGVRSFPSKIEVFFTVTDQRTCTPPS